MAKEKAESKNQHALAIMAKNMQVSPKEVRSILSAAAFKDCQTDAEFMSALIICNTYGLNPLMKQISVFKNRRGILSVVVGIDGWLELINKHPQFDGMTTTEIKGENDAGTGTGIEAIECTIYRGDRRYHPPHKERMVECYVPPYKKDKYEIKGPWQTHPVRMLKWKAINQAGRIAFGFAGVIDSDEAHRIEMSESQEIVDAEFRVESTEAAPEVQEAVETPTENTELTEAAKPPVKAWMIELFPRFKKAKEALGDAVYYAILMGFGQARHCDDLPDASVAEDCLKIMTAENEVMKARDKKKKGAVKNGK